MQRPAAVMMAVRRGLWGGGVTLASPHRMIVTTVTKENEGEMQKGKAVIDFTAPWCGPCKAMAPVFEEYSNKDWGAPLQFYKVDVDDLPHLAAQHQVTGVPQFSFLNDGEVVSVVIGADRQRVADACEELAKK